MQNFILNSLPTRYHSQLKSLDSLYELRLYRGQSIATVTPMGVVTISGGPISTSEFDYLFNSLCNGSPYIYEEEIKNGYFTLAGCRIGICGSAISEKNEIVSVKNIRSLNIRFAREIKNCAEDIFISLGKNVNGGMLLAGAPATGKTTLLRDLARLLSKYGKKVCIMDERGELAAISQGSCRFDIGFTTDVLDGYPKQKGIEIALRCLSPDVIICDELGKGDENAVTSCANCGVDVVAAVHSDGSFSERIYALANCGAFRKIVFLKQGNVGETERIVDLKNDEIHSGSFCRSKHIFSRSEGKSPSFQKG